MSTNSSTSDTRVSQQTSDLTDAQDILLGLLTFPTGILSICGSFLIIRDFVKQKNNKNGYARIICALSCCDIWITMTSLAQSFFTSKDYNDRITSFGNHATCQAIGFSTQVGFSSYFYSGVLAFYYLTTIVHGWSESRFAAIEHYLHGLALGFPLITAVVGLVLAWYAPMELRSLCYINDYPRGCEETEETCYSALIAWIVNGIPILSIICFVIYSNVRIYRHVRWVLTRSQRHIFATAGASPRSNLQAKRLKKVRDQSILYVLACWGTAWPTLIVVNLEGANYPVSKESKLIWLYVMQCILFPSFGIWTALIYFRPRYLVIKEDFGNATFGWQIRRTVWGDSVVAPASVPKSRSEASSNTSSLQSQTVALRPGMSRQAETAGDTENSSNPVSDAPNLEAIPEEQMGLEGQVRWSGSFGFLLSESTLSSSTNMGTLSDPGQEFREPSMSTRMQSEALHSNRARE